MFIIISSLHHAIIPSLHHSILSSFHHFILSQLHLHFFLISSNFIRNPIGDPLAANFRPGAMDPLHLLDFFLTNALELNLILGISWSAQVLVFFLVLLVKVRSSTQWDHRIIQNYNAKLVIDWQAKTSTLQKWCHHIIPHFLLYLTWCWQVKTSILQVWCHHIFQPMILGTWWCWLRSSSISSSLRSPCPIFSELSGKLRFTIYILKCHFPFSILASSPHPVMVAACFQKLSPSKGVFRSTPSKFPFLSQVSWRFSLKKHILNFLVRYGSPWFS